MRANKALLFLTWIVFLVLSVSTLSQISIGKADESLPRTDTSSEVLNENLHRKLLDTIRQARQVGLQKSLTISNSQRAQLRSAAPNELRAEKISPPTEAKGRSSFDESPPPLVISLIVNGNNADHLRRSLSQLISVQRKGIQIGEVIIVGFSDLQEVIQVNTFLSMDTHLDEKPQMQGTDSAGLLRDLLVKDSELEHSIIYAQTVIEEYQITQSPSWIVRDRGYEYVYEGFQRLSDMLEPTSPIPNEDSFRF